MIIQNFNAQKSLSFNLSLNQNKVKKITLKFEKLFYKKSA
jgi:hypothetical protein